MISLLKWSTSEYAWDYLERFQAPFPLITESPARMMYRAVWVSHVHGSARHVGPCDVGCTGKRGGVDWGTGRCWPDSSPWTAGSLACPPTSSWVQICASGRAHYGRDSGDFLMFSELESALQSPRLLIWMSLARAVFSP